MCVVDYFKKRFIVFCEKYLCFECEKDFVVNFVGDFVLAFVEMYN